MTNRLQWIGSLKGKSHWMLSDINDRHSPALRSWIGAVTPQKDLHDVSLQKTVVSASNVRRTAFLYVFAMEYAVWYESIVHGDAFCNKILTICFSVYLLDVSRLTASIWPKSISWPKRKMKSSLQTYFFFWYPSKALSPLNFPRIFANSLFILLISASLLLPENTEHSVKATLR